MNVRLYNELQKAVEHIGPEWKMQNNFDDRRSRFIYSVNTYDEVVEQSETLGVDTRYALHRWYNYKTFKECERLFAVYGAVRERNSTHHSIDFYILGEHFDLKLTVYPAKLSYHPYDLTTRGGKNRMIQWLYEHQSQDGRKHLDNRLFIVCDGGSSYESLRLKSDFERIEQGIKKYMEYVKLHGFNYVDITDNDIIYSVVSDIIYIKSDN